MNRYTDVFCHWIWCRHWYFNFDRIWHLRKITEHSLLISQNILMDYLANANKFILLTCLTTSYGCGTPTLTGYGTCFITSYGCGTKTYKKTIIFINIAFNSNLSTSIDNEDTKNTRKNSICLM